MGHLHNAKALPRQFAIQHDKLLEEYYDRLQDWAIHFTHGDVGKAQDLVHELCLYITLSPPDLSRVGNLAGYLYTSLKHIYLSDLARASREALISFDPSDLDSIELVFRSQKSGDALQEQNDLRRICGYMLWRKARAKSASYFILRFFHGYYRREVSSIAKVPLSTIDPKLNEVRSEVRLYLSDPDKLRFMNRDYPSHPGFSWTALSSIEMFAELRAMVLASCDGECLPEDVLLAHYSSANPAVVSGPLLSHIVSCERCLSLIDRHFRRPTLKDREPLDCLHFDSESRNNTQGEAKLNREAMFQSIRRHYQEVFEHSPRKLFIAVDGKIVASSEVRSGRSAISVRVEQTEDAGFVEVHSASRVRLALLSLPNASSRHAYRETQHIVLSDNRWLDLTITLEDGWLNSEVVYFDPALASDFSEEIESSTQVDDSQVSGMKRRIHQALHALRLDRITQFGWALTSLALASCLLVFYFSHPRHPLSAPELINLATASETDAFRSIHEPVVVQEIHVRLGSRAIKRTLYKDVVRQRVASRNEAKPDEIEAAYSRSSLDWNSLLDAETYQRWRKDRAVAADKVYQRGRDQLVLDTTFSRGPVIEASLTLRAADYHIVSESLHFADQSVMEIAEVSYDVIPFVSTPTGVFGEPRSQQMVRVPAKPVMRIVGPSNTELAEAEVAAESALHGIAADLGEQVNVNTDEERRTVVIKGVVSDDSRKEQLASALQNIPHTEVSILTVDEALQQSSSSEGDGVPAKASSIQVMTSSPPLLESVLTSRFPDKDQRIAYVNQTLSLIQSASGRAWALNRLADRHSARDIALLSLDSRRQLNILLADHLSTLREDVSSLQNRLAEVLPDTSNTPAANTPVAEPESNDDSAVEFSQDWKDRIRRIHSSTEAVHEAVTALLTSSQPSDQENANSIEVNLRTSLMQLQVELQVLDQKIHKSDSK